MSIALGALLAIPACSRLPKYAFTEQVTHGHSTLVYSVLERRNWNAQSSRSARTGYHTRNRVEQHLGIDRFEEIRCCTPLNSALAGVWGLQSGYHNDRHVRTHLCQVRLDLKAVHLRHVLVKENTFRRMVF